jgi:DNA-binding IclR family transcriptional regulator
VKLPRSSVHRYLQTLAALGLVEQRGAPRRRYRLTATAGAAGIVAIASTGLRASAHPELVGLRRLSGCTARIAIRLRLDALLIDQAVSFAPGQGLAALNIRPGARICAPASALRQVLLANLNLEALPPELSDRARGAHAELQQVRLDGCATQAGSGAAGTSALAVPVHIDGQDEAIAAIDLIGQEPEVSLALLQRHLKDLQAAAARLAQPIADLRWAQWRPYRRRTQA